MHSAAKHGAEEGKKPLSGSVYILILTLFCTNIIYGLASPFLPAELEAKGISSGLTGLIFAIYAIASVLSALVAGMFVDRIGHRWIIMCGVLLMATAISGFGLIEDMTDPNYILALALILRYLQGTASGMTNTSVFSYAAQAYPDRVEQVISLVEGAVGIGCTVGPILGAFIYDAVGFSTTFYIIGASIAPFALLICSCLPKPTQDGQEEEEEEEVVEKPDLLRVDSTIEVEAIQVGEITYGRLFCNMRVLFATLTATMCAIFFGAPEPILSLRLDDYDLGSTYVGLIFGVEAAFYVISTFAVPYIIPVWLETRVVLITSTIVTSCATSLVGPFYTE